MTRKSLWSTATLVLLLFGYLRAGSAQESSATPKPASAYRLDFALNELEDGKKVNTRQYSMNLIPSVVFQDLKIGTRVPVEVKQGEMQYIDVGTNISARIVGDAAPPQLEVRADLSNFAPGADQSHPAAMPLLRQLRINGSTVVTSAKPIVIGAVDDPNSKRQYQLEVTTIKLR